MQTDARAPLFGREAALEDPSEIRGLDPRAVILEDQVRDRRAVCFFAHGAHADATPRRCSWLLIDSAALRIRLPTTCWISTRGPRTAPIDTHARIDVEAARTLQFAD